MFTKKQLDDIKLEINEEVKQYKEKIDEYNANPTKENFHKVIHNCPEGIELTRRVSTNYLQLKTMLNQREFHKMYSWSKDFVNMCKELPYFYEFIGRDRDE